MWRNVETGEFILEKCRKRGVYHASGVGLQTSISYSMLNAAADQGHGRGRNLRVQVQVRLPATVAVRSHGPRELTGFSSHLGVKLRNWAIGEAGGSCYSLAALSSNDSKTR